MAELENKGRLDPQPCRLYSVCVTTNFFLSNRYLFNVAYGVGKAAVDRMAADCAVELKKQNVTFISLWPGPVKTDSSISVVHQDIQFTFLLLF